MDDHIDCQHQQTRSTLRLLGPCIAGVGLVFLIIGIGSFFSSFGSFGPPRYFWCAFVGMPLLFVGGVLSKFAFLGSMTRYMANEVAPVGKDTFNYMATGTKGAVRDLASAVGEGLRSGVPAQASEVVRCHKCNEANDGDAKFCKNCGEALLKSKVCPNCEELNDPDARFCDNCGKAIGD